MKVSNYTKGYSLVETLVAVSILLLSIVGPMTIAAKGIQTGIFVGDQTTAIFLAQEEIESVVAIRNDYGLEAVFNGEESWEWTDEANSPIAACFTANGCNLTWNDSGTPLYEVDLCTASNGNCQLSYSSNVLARSRYQVGTGEPTMYTRTLHLSNIDTNEVEAIVTVRWNAKLFGGQREVVLRSSLFNLFDF